MTGDNSKTNFRDKYIFSITTILLLFFLTLILFGAVSSFGSKGFSYGNLDSYLTSFAELKSEEVNSFIKKAKNDLNLLVKSDEIQKAFGEGVFEDTNLMKEAVKKVAEETSLDVQEYIKNHPEMSLEDLQKNEDFKRIALRRVGQTGYTVFYGVETFVNYLHWNPDDIGYNHADLFEDESRIQVANLLLEGAKGEDTSGFYDREEKDGKVREKFMYISVMPDNLLGDIKLSIKATIYVDEFGMTAKSSSELDKKLEFFQETNNYLDTVLVDVDGNVIWTAEQRNNLGTNLIDGVYKDTPLARVYTETKENLNFNVSEISYNETAGRNSFFITSPLFYDGSDTLEGVVILEVGVDQMNKILKGGGIISDKSEVYLIDKNKKSITNLKYIESSGVIVDTDLTNSCIQRSSESQVVKSKNYIGETVLGVYSPITEAGWCLIVENKYSFWESILGIPGGTLVFYLFLSILVLISFVAIAINYLFKINKTLRKRRISN